MKNRIAVITRLHYDEGNPKFEKRLQMYKNYALASLLSQTDQDFDIWVWCEPWHDELVKAIHPRINVFHAEWKKRPGKVHQFFIDYTPMSKTQGFPKYATQLGLDSDDELMPKAIETVRPFLEGSRKAISFQPTKVDLATGKKYRMKSYRRRDKIAPIFAIYQPRGEFLFIYEHGHYSGMPLKFPERIHLDQLAHLNVHDDNASTKVVLNEDQEIET